MGKCGHKDCREDDYLTDHDFKRLTLVGNAVTHIFVEDQVGALVTIEHSNYILPIESRILVALLVCHDDDGTTAKLPSLYSRTLGSLSE